MSAPAHRSWTRLIAAGVLAVTGACEQPEPVTPRKTDHVAAAAKGPTDAQLAALRYELRIPVEGVNAADLRDTFIELRGKRRHAAVDILAARGTAVVSAAAGRIVQLSSSKTGGLMIFAADASGQFLLLYAHLDRYAVGLAGGMPLSRGQPLGEVGTTGNAPPDTPHLHFAISWTGGSLRWSDGLPIDPRQLLLGMAASAAMPDLPETKP